VLHHLRVIVQQVEDAPGVACVGLLLLALTVAGIVRARHLVRSLQRTLGFDAILLGVTLVWWLVNQPLEGRTLVSFTSAHGFTVGDTLGLPALVLAGVLFIAAWRHRSAAAARLGNARR
jgi:multisubunit Na+/H+ antiporter MnhG subunit